MEFNIVAILVASVVAWIIGAIWYNPKVFGTVWMKESGMTEEKLKGANMVKLYGLALLFAFLVAFTLRFLTIHQTGAFSMINGDAEGALPSYAAFIADYGDAFRTFKHGAFHGVLTSITMALPIIGMNAIFERKSAKYIFINTGYWVVSMAIMGGIICVWR